VTGKESRSLPPDVGLGRLDPARHRVALEHETILNVSLVYLLDL
jgi:hypothetical protein